MDIDKITIQQNNLRQAYFQEIINLPLNKLIDSLPKCYDQFFLDIIDSLINMLEDEKTKWDELYKELKDEEIIKEIETINQKIKIIKEHAESMKNLNIKDDSEELSDKRILIFGKNISGNVPFLNDIEKNIPIEFYQQLLDMLECLKNDDLFNMNTTKFRKLTNNDKLKDLYEIKEFKLRIYFKIINKNTIYVELARQKKDNNSVKDRNEPEKRDKALSDDYYDVINNIKENNIKSLIEENINVYEQITDMLSKNNVKVKEAI